jgi:hypothetical protein
MLVIPSKNISKKQMSLPALLPPPKKAVQTKSDNYLPPWYDESKADDNYQKSFTPVILQGRIDDALTEISAFYGFLSGEYAAAEAICSNLPMCKDIDDVESECQLQLTKYSIFYREQEIITHRILEIVLD